MAKNIVVGVLGTCEPSRVENALNVSGINRAHLRVLTSQESSAAHDNSPITFVHVAEMASETFGDDMTRGTGVLSDFGGMAVPGINDEGGSFDAFAHPEVLDYLSGVEIPAGDSEFYNEAIDDGRCVVVCTCDGEDCDATASAFKGAGLNDVRTF